ncbi:unnamed protein product [Pleuronectes platessa]|uniref:Uncharacterized protein n=1 Tax=Pleuronectes platessa TaxID=8262 RepID=A0A9N7V5K3_PLEPL|nr:unnamed protein product [Pleuronectes platessa]
MSGGFVSTLSPFQGVYEGPPRGEKALALFALGIHHHARAAVGELGEALQGKEHVGRRGGGGGRGVDLAWPVGGLIPVQALELLSSAAAQIFRFGLGCHVGSEILCSRLLPRSIQGLRAALGWR